MKRLLFVGQIKWAWNQMVRITERSLFHTGFCYRYEVDTGSAGRIRVVPLPQQHQFYIGPSHHDPGSIVELST